MHEKSNHKEDSPFVDKAKVKLPPNSMSRSYEIADLYYRMGAYSKAISYIEDIVAQGTPTAKLSCLYGDCLSQMGRSKESADNCLLAINNSARRVLVDQNGSGICADTQCDTMDYKGSSVVTPSTCALSLLGEKTAILERNIMDVLNAVEKGDESVDLLSSVEPDVVELERSSQCSSAVLAYMIQRTIHHIAKCRFEAALDYCMRMSVHVETCAPTRGCQAMIEEAKNNILLYSLFAAMNMGVGTSSQLRYFVNFLHRYLRSKVNAAVMTDRLWALIAMERFLLANVWTKSIFQSCPSTKSDISHQDLDNLFDGNIRYSRLKKFIAKECDSFPGSTPSENESLDILWEYITRFPSRLNHIALMHHCFFADAKSVDDQRVGLLSPTSQSFEKWIDINCFLFGLGNLIEFGWPRWTYTLGARIKTILMPFHFKDGIEFSFERKYKEAWWMLTSNAMVANSKDAVRSLKVANMLRLVSDETSLECEVIAVDGMLFIADGLYAITRIIDNEHQLDMLQSRVELYLTKLVTGYYCECHRPISKWWFGRPDFVNDEQYRDTVSNAELTLARMYIDKGQNLKAINALSKSWDSNVTKYSMLFKLYSADPVTYGDAITEVCKRLDYLTGQYTPIPPEPTRRAITTANVSVQCVHREATPKECLFDEDQLTLGIGHLKANVEHLTAVTVPMIRAYCLKKKEVAELVGSVDELVRRQRGTLIEERRSLREWTREMVSLRPDNIMAITKASMAMDKAVDELNEMIKCLSI